jgi:hypothetical protein
VSDRLEQIEAIKQLKARYCRAIDTKDWGLLASCYTDDTRIDLSTEEALAGFREPITGIAAVVDSMRVALGDGKSIHVTFLPEIELGSSTSATGIWGLEYSTWQPPGSTIPILHGFAYSYDDYEKRDGNWLIKSVRVELLWSEPPRLAPAIAEAARS